MKNRDTWLGLNEQLLKICDSMDKSLKPLTETDRFAIICHIFLTRGSRAIRAINLMYENDLSEFGQSVIRSLFENRVNFDWFIKLAEANRDDAVQRYLDANYLQWVKQSEHWDSTKLPRVNEAETNQIRKNEAEIKARYSEEEYKKMRRDGFSGIPLEQRADKLGHGALYCVIYRTFSRNIHGSDFAELLAQSKGRAMGEIVDNTGLCIAQFSLLGIAEKVNSLFSLGAKDELEHFKIQHEKFARETKVMA